ncbi:NAD(P)/FAD-dependent oxidoreductase [Cryobacterium sp. TMT1-21]|uniref:NAD(P)/FAD-dependent oxidoreductase n=1 Tax=Cryobacterium shii TaxID=1259235 RepID=A0AAQ2C3Z1_9MICO|nr:MULTISPECIES: NAD(P)/FAD-dependent oxidoreductase [Cryobacterium]TFC42497.1 NAD(P)/FAD-dependent oxidoreductase [Cryobacterium shii]TFD13243.1 NAD(P)/FAD-dependent oxidoreductase [Cryobacterium sp. TMT1-21]TFD18664.1 NAD(P)/FAD-dependent oxidoreductase [Cryobacterium sp. TMT4-10]TFD28466.1 NAD(P)/FAD-dependent oxidoreductase [Cryobacterium sp. TMT2-23]TFD35436.1 NAD(P)/FAD-dependent oxidoreductase [Cryobacterium sp. TMT2-10]
MPAASSSTYDVIVIGAGAVGENVADRTSSSGLRTVIVEAELVGGECSYWACMPSKALLRSGAALAAARRVGGAVEAVTGDVDVAAVLRRRDAITHDWSDESQVRWLEKAGIALVRGHARLSGVREVTVTSADGRATVLTATHAVVISTGSAALLPDIPGLASVSPWTSREATSARGIPDSLAIIGGGVVAAEMATAYASLGAEVTMIVRGGLLSTQEPFAGELVTAALRAGDVTVLTGVSTTGAARNGDGDVTLTLSNGTRVTATEVLVATGRLPRTRDVGLETVGLVPGDWLEVDDTLLVQGSSPELAGAWLYATGDVNHRALLTHQGKYQARAAGDVIAARAAGTPVDDQPWGTHAATADHAAVPQVTFTDPEVASVGLTRDAAERAGFHIRVLDYNLGWVAGASVHADDYTGSARAIVDLDREVLLGVTFVGPDVAELLHAATIAVVGEVPIRRLWHAVPSYPTLSEVWLRLLEEYGRP